MKNTLNTYREYLQFKNLGAKTITRYESIVIDFLSEYDIDKITKQELIQYLNTKGSVATQKQIMAAIGYLFKSENKINLVKKIPNPKQKVFVPNILSLNEIKQILASIENVKHRMIIELIYSCALRISELQNLEVAHIDKDENKIKIVSGKGNIDAYIPIIKKTKSNLRMYYIIYKPTKYLFEGYNHKKYSSSSIRKILQRALLECGISRRIRVHDLRHSRATHLLDAGVSIKHIKELLRHKKQETTDRYLHLSTKSLETAIESALY